MIYRNLGKSNLKVSLIGYGTWALSGRGWPGVNPFQAARTVEIAIENGVNFFDTAPVYGFGHSEELLGDILRGCRDKVIIASKCGLVLKGGQVVHDLSRDTILADLEGSLTRLKTEYIDLYQIHWPDLSKLDDVFSVLVDLKNQGVIRQIGVCNFTKELLIKANTLADIVSFQGVYNYLQRECEEEILPFCAEKDIAFLAYSPLAQGLLSGSFRDDFRPGKSDVRRMNPLFSDRNRYEKSLDIVRGLGSDPVSSALKFVAVSKTVSCIIAGATKPYHMMKNIKALSDIDE